MAGGLPAECTRLPSPSKCSADLPLPSLIGIVTGHSLHTQKVQASMQDEHKGFWERRQDCVRRTLSASGVHRKTRTRRPRSLAHRPLTWSWLLSPWNSKARAISCASNMPPGMWAMASTSPACAMAVASSAALRTFKRLLSSLHPPTISGKGGARISCSKHEPHLSKHAHEGLQLHGPHIEQARP